ncbi:MAG: hypothetical protein M9920_13910 [Verrucomicrobiae bacterium]|nr:hypothetical protein [Verrucomicrobiae bacterium]
MNCENLPRPTVDKPSGHHRRVRAIRFRQFGGFLLALILLPLAARTELAENRVLELDGNGSYVELPPDIFHDLKEVTVEVWAKWAQFNKYSRLFEFGAAQNSMSVFNHFTDPDLRFNLYPKYINNEQRFNYVARANGVLRSNEWMHIAAVAGSGGMKLYLNGEVVALNTNAASLADIQGVQTNRLGRGLTLNPIDQDFRGQLDEVRVWNYQRTPEQIRKNMNRRLAGSEPGLVGLWNFEDGRASDATPRANHGKLIGQARVVVPDFPGGLQLIASELIATPTAVPGAAPASAVSPREIWYGWIAGALVLIAALLFWVALLLKRHRVRTPASTEGTSTTLLPSARVAGTSMQEQALAELTEFAKQSLVQGLYSQRNALLETQHKAQQELAELEARFVALKLPERIQAYERRIVELERDLESRTGELRELTKATLSLLRRKVAEERELDRTSPRFN